MKSSPTTRFRKWKSRALSTRPRLKVAGRITTGSVGQRGLEAFRALNGAPLALLLAGCAVGPNFKKPAAPEVDGYTPTTLTNTVGTMNWPGGGPQHLVSGGDIPGDWWRLFHSQPLNDLIELSLSNNPSLKAAQAALTAAR